MMYGRKKTLEPVRKITDTTKTVRLKSHDKKPYRRSRPMKYSAVDNGNGRLLSGLSDKNVETELRIMRSLQRN
jgi:hypothetical protein